MNDNPFDRVEQAWSHHLRETPAPTVPPGFEQRVMAHVRDASRECSGLSSACAYFLRSVFRPMAVGIAACLIVGTLYANHLEQRVMEQTAQTVAMTSWGTTPLPF